MGKRKHKKYKTYDHGRPMLRNTGNTTKILQPAETLNPQDLNTLYRANWIVKKLIDIIPEDMLKNGYRLNTSLEAESKSSLARLERITRLKAKVLEGLRWGRLYGGAIGLLLIDGHEDMLDEPLELDDIMPDSFKGILIIDRHRGISPSLELVADFASPFFGMPLYYDLTLSATHTLQTNTKIHHSRIIRFTGRDLPYTEKLAEAHWGASELEHIFESLTKNNNVLNNIEGLTKRANLLVYQIAGMGLEGLLNPQSAQRFIEKLNNLNAMMNNNSLQAIDREDNLKTVHYTFAGMAEISEIFMMDIAGAAEIPVTRLFMRSPAGMNATGESDMQMYYDSIAEKQESYLRPIYDILLPIMCMSALGAVPDDLDYDFNPLKTLDDAERASLASQLTQSISQAYTSGIIDQRLALKELKAAADKTGLFFNIDDEDVERAARGTSHDELTFGEFGSIMDDSDNSDDEWITINGTPVRVGKDGELQGAVGEKIMSHTTEAEKQAKIDSINIDFDGDTELPPLNAETISEFGFEDKPVLLKKNILEKNKMRHPEIPASFYGDIIGSALYNPDAVVRGHKGKPYYNFIHTFGENQSGITLLQVEKTSSGIMEVINFHLLRDSSVAQKKQN